MRKPDPSPVSPLARDSARAAREALDAVQEGPDALLAATRRLSDTIAREDTARRDRQRARTR